MHVHVSVTRLFQDTETSAAETFVSNVTTISQTSLDLRWMVQPTVITSVSPSSGRTKSKARGATPHSSPPSGVNKTKPSNNRKGQREQVCAEGGFNMSVNLLYGINQSINHIFPFQFTFYWISRYCLKTVSAIKTNVSLHIARDGTHSNWCSDELLLEQRALSQRCL